MPGDMGEMAVADALDNKTEMFDSFLQDLADGSIDSDYVIGGTTIAAGSDPGSPATMLITSIATSNEMNIDQDLAKKGMFKSELETTLSRKLGQG